jgi:hypothetical protein
MTRKVPVVLTPVMLAILTVAAGAAVAAEERCGRNPTPEAVVGAYEMSVSDILMLFDGFRHREPVGGSVSVTLRQVDDGLRLTGVPEFGDIALRFSNAEAHPCSWLDDADFTAVADAPPDEPGGCEIAELPRLVGDFPWKSRDGYDMTYSVCLVLYGADRWYGSLTSVAYTERGKPVGLQSVRLVRDDAVVDDG